MATDILIYNTTPVSATIQNSVVAAAAAAQSGVIDFGTPRAATWLARFACHMAAAAASGANIEVYIGYSTSSTAGFPAALGTAAGAYTGYASAGDSKRQLDYVGSLVLTTVVSMQTADIGMIMPKLQYGVLMYYNNSAASVGTTTTAAATFTPIKDQSQ